MTDDIISKSFGIPPLKEFEKETDFLDVEILDDDEEIEEMTTDVVTTSVVEPVSMATDTSKIDEDHIKDIEQAKYSILSMIENGQQALNELLVLAAQSENPRTYEVAATMIKTLVDANKDFIGVSEKKKQAKTPINNIINNTTNNNLVLTTNDLLKILKNQKEEE